MREILFKDVRTIRPEHYDNAFNWSLRENEIHTWIAELDLSFVRINKLQETLSPEERRRSEQFHFYENKKRFIVRRGILKRILGNYLAIQPHLLKFSYGEYGKPHLPDEINPQKIHFNTSHSGEFGLFVFTRNRTIGADIERVRDLSDIHQLVERCFTEQENVVFHALPQAQKREAFFNGWVRKEAFLKATGFGLSLPFETCEVTINPGKLAKLLSIRGSKKEVARWEMHEIRLFSGYVGAVVVKKHGNC